MSYQREVINQKVNIFDVCYRYGMTLNRQGFAHCPFHEGDNTPSFKVYSKTNSFYCFGCGKGGDLIKFVELLFSLDYKDAVFKLDCDFCLGINKKPTFSQFKKIMKSKQIKQKEAQKQEIKEKKIDELWALYIKYDINLRRYRPDFNDEYLHPLFAEALNNIDKVGYLIDCEEL